MKASQDKKEDVTTPTLSETVVKNVASEISILQDKKAEVMVANNKTASYIKDRVFKYRKTWWNKWLEMMNSDDMSTQKTALIEFNKLQARVLPTQLEGSNGSQIMVNIIGMGVDNPVMQKIEESNTIEGEVVE